MTYDNWTQLDLFKNTEDHGSLQEDSLVNLGPLPEKEKDIRIQKTVISGQKCFASYQISNQNSCLERMCQDLLTFPWESNARALTWKRNTKSQHLIFQLVPSRLPTKEKEFGSSPSENLWATPNTLDHLPPRSEEATKKMQTGHRKGRTRPSNLREQVDPKTMSMYPTPTTKGFGHASEGQTLIFRRLVEEGKMTEEEAQQMMNGTTLRPPRMKEWMWPTPTVQDSNKATKKWREDHQNNLTAAVFNPEKLWPTPTANEPRDNKKIDHYIKTGEIRHSPTGYKNPRRLLLEETVIAEEKMKATTMWPTPTTQDNPQVRGKGKTIGTKRGTTLGGAVREAHKEEQLWPTPRVKGEEGLETLLKRKTLDQALMHNLKAATEYWPTPTSRDHKGGYRGGRIVDGKVSRATLDVTVQYTDNQEKKKVQLHPEWVSTYLMGYPRHWLSSNLELQELEQTYQTEPRN